MKKSILLTFVAGFLLLPWSIAQNTEEANKKRITGIPTDNSSPDLQYFRSPGYDGLNIFETPKKAGAEFNGLKVKIGADLALQYQALDHSNASSAPELIPLGQNVNLPTANLNIDVQLYKGLRMHLRTFLSSRHHNEAWVKGGHIQVDRLDFIKEGFASGIMDYVTLRAGQDQPNYGDAKFRRSDNANTIYNPFVGNYIMDAYTTEPFLEITAQSNGILAVGGITNGLMNPTVNNVATGWGSDQYAGEYDDMKPTYYGKIGYDKQLNDDLRVRLTGSFYTAQGTDNGNHLYSGDRAGARYYNVMDYIDPADSSVVTDFRSGRINPGFTKETAFQVNPFVKYQGLEFFGVFEQTSGNNGADNMKNGQYTQLGAELIYRFGSWEQFYLGGRYNSVSGYDNYAEGGTQPDTKKVTRINAGGGWFLTKNTLVKVEYVTQNYDDHFSNQLESGQFNGTVIEAVISF